MYLFLLILAVVIVIGSLIATLRVGKEVNQSIEKYEKEGDSVQNQVERSHQYESHSLKRNVPILSYIYIATFVMAILGVIIFLYFQL